MGDDLEFIETVSQAGISNAILRVTEFRSETIRHSFTSCTGF
jgi:hypothetical protein